jgi:hypothetical protein
MALFQPDWPAPDSISALSTTRSSGHSNKPFDSFNLADHVDDDIADVTKNRAALVQLGQLPRTPCWLNQTHSNKVIHTKDWHTGIEADACYSDRINDICIVMTADCLPLLICDLEGNEVVAIHAGWRGLANNIIEQTVARFKSDNRNLLVWLGPAIGPNAFEVGGDVVDRFIQRDPQAEKAFKAKPNNHYLADIYQLARQQLYQLGIENIFGGNRCTMNEPDNFFSFRRDGQTGRMASMIWINKK